MIRIIMSNYMSHTCFFSDAWKIIESLMQRTNERDGCMDGWMEGVREGGLRKVEEWVVGLFDVGIGAGGKGGRGTVKSVVVAVVVVIMVLAVLVLVLVVTRPI